MQNKSLSSTAPWTVNGDQTKCLQKILVGPEHLQTDELCDAGSTGAVPSPHELLLAALGVSV